MRSRSVCTSLALVLVIASVDATFLPSLFHKGEADAPVLPVSKQVSREHIREVPVVKEVPIIKEIVKEVPQEVVRRIPVDKVVYVDRPVEVLKEVFVDKFVPIDRPVEVIKEVPVEKIVEERVEVPKEVRVPYPVEIEKVVHVPYEVERIEYVDVQHVIPAPVPVAKKDDKTVQVGFGLGLLPPGLPAPLAHKLGKIAGKKIHKLKKLL